MEKRNVYEERGVDIRIAMGVDKLISYHIILRGEAWKETGFARPLLISRSNPEQS